MSYTPAVRTSADPEGAPRDTAVPVLVVPVAATYPGVTRKPLDRPENSCTIRPRTFVAAVGATYTIFAGRAAGAAQMVTDVSEVSSAVPSGYHRLCASSPMETDAGWARSALSHAENATSQFPSELATVRCWQAVAGVT